MKKKLISVILGAILILMILSSSAYLQDVSALERTTTAAVALANGSPYFLGDMNGELYYIFQSHLWKTDGTPAGTVLISMAATRWALI